jgi:hypothetical protein
VYEQVTFPDSSLEGAILEVLGHYGFPTTARLAVPIGSTSAASNRHLMDVNDADNSDCDVLLHKGGPAALSQKKNDVLPFYLDNFRIS